MSFWIQEHHELIAIKTGRAGAPFSRSADISWKDEAKGPMWGSPGDHQRQRRKKEGKKHFQGLCILIHYSMNTIHNIQYVERKCTIHTSSVPFVMTAMIHKARTGLTWLTGDSIAGKSFKGQNRHQPVIQSWLAVLYPSPRHRGMHSDGARH